MIGCPNVEVRKDHPAILGWYAWDEPDLGHASHTRLRQLYELLCELDPYHPVITLPAYVHGIHEFADTCDIIMPDPYPRFLQGADPALPMSLTSPYMDACRVASKGQKAWWCTPQAFDWASQYKNSRPPSFTELRCQQLQAYIGGARGILWFVDRYRLNSLDLDMGLAFLGRESRRLRKALLAPETRSQLKVHAPAGDALQASARKVGDHWYVLAVNTGREPQKSVRFVLPDLHEGTIYVASENRTVSADGKGTFVDDFGAYVGHIYTTDPALAFGPTVTSLKQRIEENREALAKPGNLAHRSRGALVSLSSRNRFGAHAKHLNDGHLGMTWTPGPAPKDSQEQIPPAIEVTFPKSTQIGRVLLLGCNAPEYRMEIRSAEGWKTVYEGKSRPGLPIQAAFTPETTDALRIVFPARSKGASAQEIEVYAE